ncbi:MAG: flagellar protein FlgN [Firmicutes bacterium]|nr:flagellar protein FlgN [Bacillota bacterium]
MEQTITDLLAVLDEEISLHRELLKLAEEKKAILTGRLPVYLAKLEQINGKEAQLAQSVAAAERKRIQITDDLASQVGSHLAATLLELAEAIGPPENEGLLERRHTLGQLLSELKAVNALNRKLLDRELAYVNFCLNLLTGTDDSKQGYSDVGSKQKTACRRNILDWKA